MKATVSIFTEIPETLHESLKNYLETHPDWDENRVQPVPTSDRNLPIAKIHTWGCIEGSHDDSCDCEANFISLNVMVL